MLLLCRPLVCSTALPRAPMPHLPLAPVATVVLPHTLDRPMMRPPVRALPRGPSFLVLHPAADALLLLARRPAPASLATLRSPRSLLVAARIAVPAPATAADALLASAPVRVAPRPSGTHGLAR